MENMLGPIGEGYKLALKTLNGGRLALAAGCLGAAKEALKLAFDYSLQRRQFRQPIANFQTIQNYLAEMAAKIYFMESAVYRAAKDMDEDKDIRFEAGTVKLVCSEMASEVIDKALQIHGGYGYSEEYPLARMYRNAKIAEIFEGTNEIQKLLVFKEVFNKEGLLESVY